jgi:hypothetical protein
MFWADDADDLARQLNTGPPELPVLMVAVV